MKTIKQPPSNMRVQRTRSSASPPRSPLTRGPLGGRRITVVLALVGLALGCGMPVHPTRENLFGLWKVDYVGHETLELRADGSFTQSVVDIDGHSRKVDGRWDVGQGARGETVIRLQSAINSLDRVREGSSLADIQPSALELYAVSEWGTLTLEFDPDSEGFTKVR